MNAIDISIYIVKKTLKTIATGGELYETENKKDVLKNRIKKENTNEDKKDV